MTPTLLPLPPFYAPANASVFGYAPNHQQLFAAATEWRSAHAITDAGSSPANVHLLLIDVQRDFCFPQGSLYVGGRSGSGAMDDSRRIAEFIYRNANTITNITATMDTHSAFQIFFPSFWVDRDGAPLSSFREITVEDVGTGHVRPNPALAPWLCGGDVAWLTDQVRFYCGELERAGKYKLYLWPPHCILGSDGHALVGVVHEARMFHAYLRNSQSWVETKGDHPLTENYSVLRPEVLSSHDGRALAKANTALVKTLLSADAVIVGGQAASHCVRSSIDDLLEAINATDRSLARKVYVLSDCMSSVAVPDGHGGFLADFTPQAEQALARYANAGMHIVRSTDPIASWPQWR